MNHSPRGGNEIEVRAGVTPASHYLLEAGSTLELAEKTEQCWLVLAVSAHVTLNVYSMQCKGGSQTLNVCRQLPVAPSPLSCSLNVSMHSAGVSVCVRVCVCVCVIPGGICRDPAVGK